MRFLKIYRTHMITQKPRLTTFSHLDDVVLVLVHKRYLNQSINHNFFKWPK